MDWKNKTFYHWLDSKREIILLSFAGLVSFGAGFLILFAKYRVPDAAANFPHLQDEIIKFTSSTKPLLPNAADLSTEFLDPQRTIPNYHLFPFAEVQRLQKARTTCVFESLRPRVPILDKAKNFYQRLCQKQTVPINFIRIPPYFTPSGETYALATYRHYVDQELPPKELRAWVRDNLAYFHVLELNEVMVDESDLQTLPHLKLLLTFDWAQLNQIVEGQDIIVGSTSVLIHTQKNQTSYNFYSRASWDDFWEDSLFHPILKTNDQQPSICYLEDNGLCWQLDYKRSLFRTWNPISFFLICVTLTALLLFVKLGHILILRKKEKEKLKFSLEMLTHELRTPIANLTLFGEELRSMYDELPAQGKFTSIRLLDQLARVRRVTEASRHYLTQDFKTSDIIEPTFNTVDSFSEFAHNLIEPFVERVTFNLEVTPDLPPIRLDPYWTMICVNNIIQNALDHGQSPVEVTMAANHSHWSLTVVDQGQSRFDPYLRSPLSHGMGLGLTLVRRIAPYLGGSLSFDFNPTRVTLQFKLTHTPQTLERDLNEPHTLS